ncbi:MAG: UDP-glucose/GDP-mannose dehydrogenase family protein [Endomicrobium sp.]|uniref:UDP-glucose dehydrogenase family protein n=1 Tax=Candidatus Endomicrobiellum cubanum TaxID=3242325 RepID=UPI0028251489|nr:UDP-glucose/GDP-mannose dehydrogenase family protein [Endomicrobium sp.]
MNILVIGAGYVGLTMAVCFSELGHSVICIDKQKNKINALLKGKLTIFEKNLDKLLIKNLKSKRLEFDISMKNVVNADVVMISVGTPFDDSLNRYEQNAIYCVAKNITKFINKYTIIVIKSTVEVGTCDRVEQIIKEANPKADFDVVSIPEFLREGSAVYDFFNPDRIIVGTESQHAKDVIKKLYKPFKKKKFVFTSRCSSELIKCASNSFLAMKIHFINEMADFCEKVGGNVYDVAHGMGLDKRIGVEFLKTGPGYGGGCFPKDTKALASLGKRVGANFNLIEAVICGNENRIKSFATKTLSFVENIKNAKIAFLGLAFKSGTDDCRFSPAIDIVLHLINKGTKVCVYDPAATKNARSVLKTKVSYAKNEYEAAKDADIMVFATEWKQFRSLDWAKLSKIVNSKIIFDMRNIVDRQEALKYGFECYKTGC